MSSEIDRYTYRVTWSEDDQEHVGLCTEFPSLSWLEETPEKAPEPAPSQTDSGEEVGGSQQLESGEEPKPKPTNPEPSSPNQQNEPNKKDDGGWF